MSEQLYTQRHNRVCEVICWHISKNIDVPVTENLWGHEPKVITENMEVPTAHVQPYDPIKREHRKQSVATRYHTWVQTNREEGIAD